MQLSDRTAIVTGGAAGIGRATAIALAEEGADVIVADIDEANENTDTYRSTADAITAAGGTAIHHRADVTNEEEVKRLIKTATNEFGGLDILVNNAGTTMTGSVEVSDTDDWERVLDVNLTGVFLCSKHAVPHLKESQCGRIINISSARGFVGAPDKAAYCASKGGVSNLTRQMAVDYGDAGITVNAVCPGPVKTQMIGNDDSDWSEYRDHVVTPFIGEPDDIASVVLFLASDEARYITGHNLLVDGGANIH